MGRTREKVIELAHRLVLGTQEGQVSWQESDRPHAYQYSSGASTAVIASEDDDGTAPYELEVRDADGIVVESLSTSYYRLPEGKGRRPASWNRILADLYETARGDAHNVEQVLNSLLETLPALPPPDPDDVPF